MSEKHTFQVEERVRLDLFLVKVWPALRSDDVLQMVQQGLVLVNDLAARKPGQYLQSGDRVVVVGPEPSVDEPPSEDFAPSTLADLVHEEASFVVLDKPAGVALYPSRHQPTGDTLLAQLREQYPEVVHIGGVDRAGIFQRLEPETSGLVLAARTDAAYRAFKRALKRHQIAYRYLVLVEGNLPGEDVIDMPIGNVKRARRRLMVAREGRPARTAYKALRHYKESGQAYTLLEVAPESSRLHQIRVHLSWYGYPVVGDTLYGSPARDQILHDRLFLHLGAMTFPHPLTGDSVLMESVLPIALNSLLQFMVRGRG